MKRNQANELIGKEELRNFYLENPPDLSMIHQLNRRHLRMVLPSGRFLKIRDVIRNTDDLQKWLQRLTPLHVYYSTATWLNPVILKPRPKKPGTAFLESGIILTHDIAFDIDRTPLLRKNIDAARVDALRVLDFMKDKGYPLLYCAFSGSKGFHVVFRDPDREVIPDPFEREMTMIRDRTRLVQEVMEEGIGIDGAVTKDTRRIFRVPGTVNTRTGYCCTVLSMKDLESPVSDLLRKIPRVPSAVTIQRFQPLIPRIEKLWPNRQKVEEWWNGFAVRERRGKPGLEEKNRRKGEIEGVVQGKDQEKTGINKKRGKPEGDPGKYYYTTFLQSNVLGMKGQHAVLISLAGTSRKRVQKKLAELIRDFTLTDFYLFRHAEKFVAISLCTVSRNRYQKILDQVGAEIRDQLKKYHVTSIRIGPLVDLDLREVEPPMDFVGVIQAPDGNNLGHDVSRGHLHFIRKHGIDTFDYPEVHGKEGFRIVDAVVKMG